MVDFERLRLRIFRNKTRPSQAPDLESVPRSSHSSISSTASSQVSDGSIDGTFTALEELIADHIDKMWRHRPSREGGKVHYVRCLLDFQAAVTEKKADVTERNQPRDTALVILYHDVTTYFDDVVGDPRLMKAGVVRKDSKTIYTDFCNRLLALHERFTACMVPPSEPTMATDLAMVLTTGSSGLPLQVDGGSSQGIGLFLSEVEDLDLSSVP